MWIIILIVTAIIIIVAVKAVATKGSASSDDSALLFSYYEAIRNNYYSESRYDPVYIASPLVEYNGTYVLSAFLAVYVSEEDDSGVEKAQALGMQTREIDGKFEHQFVIRKKYSQQAKRQLLQSVMGKIQTAYPNEILHYDDSSLILFGIRN